MSAPDPKTLLRRGAALIEVLGGLLLAALALKVVVRAGARPAVIAVAGALALVGALLLLAGIWLWHGARRGRVLSLIAQAVQLPHLVTAPLVYHFCAPATVAVGIGTDGRPHAFALLRASLSVTWDADPDATWIGVNLVALLVVMAVVATWPGRLETGDRQPLAAA